MAAMPKATPYPRLASLMFDGRDVAAALGLESTAELTALVLLRIFPDADALDGVAPLWKPATLEAWLRDGGFTTLASMTRELAEAVAEVRAAWARGCVARGGRSEAYFMATPNSPGYPRTVHTLCPEHIAQVDGEVVDSAVVAWYRSRGIDLSKPKPKPAKPRRSCRKGGGR